MSHGARLAAALGAGFHAVHCVPTAAYPLGPIDVATRKRLHERARGKLHRTLKRNGAAAGQVHIVEGTVESAVPQLAVTLQAQLLVLGAISRRGLKRFAIGNTAERIINDAPCDLLIIKPEGFKVKLGRTRKQTIFLPGATPRKR